MDESSGMSYRMRDNSSLDSMSTTFQAHPQQSFSTLGSHMSYPISPSGSSQTMGSTSTSPLTYVGSVGPKRKPAEGSGEPLTKRRRDNDDVADNFDIDGAAGAKHWSDEEKTRLFTWLMGANHDDHWNALRATKNSCLRECAMSVFDNKKSYQALKGCYERNFNLFRQIYALEAFHAQNGLGHVNMALLEPERLREFEKRLQVARKGGCDVGNVTSRTIDHWHRIGWYELFYRRWHGDPATTRSIHTRGATAGPQNSSANDDIEDDDASLDYHDINRNALNEMNNANRMNGIPPPNQMSFLPPPTNIYPETAQPVPQQPAPPPPPPPPPLSHTSQPPPHVHASTSPTQPASSEQPIIHFSVTQGMIQTYMQYLQVQTQASKLKVELMRKREEREIKESTERREFERLRQERETADHEHTKQAANIKQQYDRAIQILDHPSVDASVKQAAGEFLKRIWTV